MARVIRQESCGLTLRAYKFRDNENGLLTTANPQSDIVIKQCVFERNGAGDGQSHNFYVGRVHSLTMTGSLSQGARTGHLLKSRATINRLYSNRLVDGTSGTSSHLVDLPDGGRSVLAGNILQHGSLVQNRMAISWAEESAANPGREVLAVSSMFPNQRAAGEDFLRVEGSASTVSMNDVG